MKFVVSSNLLLSNLQTVGRVIASKNQLPILDYFLFEIRENRLTITASDTETRMETSVEISDVQDEGKAAVPAKNLLDALKELPEQPIVFEINPDSHEMQIYYENGKYHFAGQSGDDYPHPRPLKEESARLSLSTSDLLNGISRSIFASGEDELRPVMNGVYFDITTENIVFVASDGHKLARFKNLAVRGNETSSFILPRKSVNLLRAILPKETGEVVISFDTDSAYITLPHFVIACRLIDGRYPNYNSVIPKDNPYKATIDRVNFVNALKRVMVSADPSTSLIRLSFSSNSIFISSQDINFCTSAEETIACLYDGVKMDIGFKGTHLIEILNNISSEEVVLELADPSRPGLILPAENEEDEDLLMLLMPMMLS
jgi:DNA polymerase-3 subunit beta